MNKKLIATLNRDALLHLAKMRKGITTVNRLSVESKIGGQANFQELMKGNHTPTLHILLQVLHVGLGLDPKEIQEVLGGLLNFHWEDDGGEGASKTLQA